MNPIRTLLFLAATLMGLGSAAAEGLSVTTVVHGGAQLQAVQVHLWAVRVDGTGLPIDRVISVPGTETIDLPLGNWELSIPSPRFWSAPSVVSKGQAVSLHLWPAGILRGTIKAERKGVRVQDLRVSFASAMENPDTELPAGDSVCSLEDERWRCLVPAGTHDLRLLSRGFAAEFRWKQEVREGKETDLGQLTLRPGASLIGFVTTGRGVKAEMRDVVITAKPRSLSTGAPRRSYATSANARGFFQIAGLAPGDYLVHAEAKRLRSEDRPATIVEDRNAELRFPLVLDTPRKIVLTIISSITTEKNVWHLRLYREVAGAGRMEEVLTAVTDGAGRWSAEVVPGQYLLQIGHADGSVWRSAELAVEATDVYLNLSIPVTQVVGTVKLGDRPLPDARLIFGGEQGAEKLTLVTDRDGRFSGELPAKEDVRKRWKITIEADAPQVQRTAEYEASQNDEGEIRFDIELPKTVVTGRVVNEDGSAEPGSFVTLRSSDGSVFEQMTTGADGHFEISGFEPGVYRIQADAFQRSSEIMDIQASETDAPAIEIVLRSDVLVRGRIRSRNTVGVEAKLTALQRDVRTDFIPNTTTDGNGLFELKLPPKTRTFDLVVQAPGFALATGRVAVQDNRILTITVDQTGGGLAVEIPRTGDAVIRHDGAEFPARWLARLSGGSIDARDGWDLASLVNVEAGEYALCANGRCRTGIVTPHGTLLLSLRSDD